MAIASFSLLAACALNPFQQGKANSEPGVATQTNAANVASAQPRAFKVSFDTNKYDINLAGRRTIGDVATVTQGDSAAFVTIVGRADNEGSADHNTQLSQRRATAVRAALIATGKVAPDHIETAWTGHAKHSGLPLYGAADPRDRVVDMYIH